MAKQRFYLHDPAFNSVFEIAVQKMMDAGVQISNVSALQADIEYVEYDRDARSVALKFKADIGAVLDWV